MKVFNWGWKVGGVKTIKLEHHAKLESDQETGIDVFLPSSAETQSDGAEIGSTKETLYDTSRFCLGAGDRGAIGVVSYELPSHDQPFPHLPSLN